MTYIRRTNLAIADWTSQIKCGFRLKDKLNIFIFMVVDQWLHLLKIGFPINSLKTKAIQSIVVNADGNKFNIVDNESLFILTHDFESWMNKFLNLKKGAVFLDVGSHVGKHAIQMAKKVGEEGVVIAVEAHPLNYQVLTRNIKLNKLTNVKSFNVAAWNKSGRFSFYEGISSGRHSLKSDLQAKLGNTHIEHKSYQVIAKPMDELVNKVGLKISFVKIDAGYAEFEILQGLKQTLSRDHPIVLAEIMKANQKEVFAFLHALGYEVQMVSDADDFIAHPLVC